MLNTATLSVETPYVRRGLRPAMQHRLFCFPHAGAGSSYFTQWPSALPQEIEVVAVQLPGREDRFREQPATRLQPLVRDVMLALGPYLQGSFSFFGHSAGALLVYELAQALHERRRCMPVHLFVSGQSAPDLPPIQPPIHALPEDTFRAAVRALGGLTDEIWGNEDLLSLLLPALRADFTLWETYVYQARPALSSSIIALGGRSDERAPAGTLEAWRKHTNSDFHVVLFEGDHFYINGPNRDLLLVISNFMLDAVGTDKKQVLA